MHPRLDEQAAVSGGGLATMATLDVRSRSLKRSLARRIPLIYDEADRVKLW
jgi:hypothetical protein